MPRTIPPPVSRGFPGGAATSWGDLVDQALRRGIVSGAQAEQLRALASSVPVPAPRTPPAAPPPRLARAFVAEALGYVGGALVVVAGFVLAQQFWADLRPWAQVGILALLAGSVLAAGAVVHGEAGTPLGRLRSVLWALGTVAVTGTLGVWASEVAGLEDAGMAVATFAPATAVAAWLWWHLRRSLQEVVLVIGLVMTGTAVLALVDVVVVETWGGLLVWALGVGWLLLALGGLVAPPRTGVAIGAVLALVGPMALADAGRWGALVGLATAGALAALSVSTRRTVLLGLGVVGVFLYVPQVVFAWFGDRLGVPLALVVTGGVLLVASAWIARTQRDAAT